MKNTEEKLKFIARDNNIKNIIEDNEQIDMMTKIQLIALLED